MIAKHGNLFRSLQRPSGRGNAGAALESLEPRTLLAGHGMSLSADGILTITGTDGADQIVVDRYQYDPSKLIVCAWSDDDDPEDPGWGGLAFDVDQVKGIRILGKGGDDCLLITNGPERSWQYPVHNLFGDEGLLGCAVTLDGGAGDDELWAETTGAGTMIGGAGDDVAYSFGLGRSTFAAERVQRRAIVWDSHPVGDFVWHGAADEVYADPWVTYNAGGTYTGAQAPPVAAADDRNDDAAVKNLEPAPPADPAPVTLPAIPFATRPITPAHTAHVWDDAAQD